MMRKYLNIYFSLLMAFPAIGNCSNFGSPRDFFMLFFTFSGLGSLIIYSIFLGIFMLKGKRLDNGIYNIPVILISMGLFMSSMFEIVLMNLAGGFFGGSLLGGTVTTILYLYIIKHIKKSY